MSVLYNMPLLWFCVTSLSVFFWNVYFPHILSYILNFDRLTILNLVLLKVASTVHKWKHWSVVVHRNGCVHNTGSVLSMLSPAFKCSEFTCMSYYSLYGIGIAYWLSLWDTHRHTVVNSMNYIYVWEWVCHLLRSCYVVIAYVGHIIVLCVLYYSYH